MTTWILDPGHEGMSPGGLYLRQGKQSPSVPPGIYEGEFNRAICELILHHLLNIWDEEAVITSPGPINIPLASRCAYVNKLHKARGDCVLISIHANAAPVPGWSEANGTTVFHRPRGLLLRYPAKVRAAQERLAGLVSERMKGTGIASRGVKDARYTILRVDCPAVLVECGFMTHRGDAEYMASSKGRQQIADAINQAMVDYEGGE